MGYAHYVQNWQYYESRPDGWPTYTTEEIRNWFTASILEILKAHPEGLNMHQIYELLRRKPDNPKWALYDSWYACIHRALLAIDARNTWRLKREGEL